MSDSAPVLHREKERIEASSKKAWTKPSIWKLYQIEDVFTHPTVDPAKSGEVGDVYRGPS